MEICGIIAEYNPFHRGHAYQLAKARQITGADRIVCAMSTSFTQRGAPALLPAHTRARMALEGGADLLLALPLPFAMAGAERFARGGVSILAQIGCTSLCFGSESADADLLCEVADLLLSPTFSEALRPHLDRGIGFAAARERAVSDLLGEPAAQLLRQPNDLLAVEYVKAIRTLRAPLRIVPIQRIGAGHDAPSPLMGFASASYLRHEIRVGRSELLADYLPPASLRILREAAAGGELSSPHHLDRVVLQRLRSMSKEDFSRLPDLSEGLGNRLWRIAQEASSLETFLQKATSRRHPTARIRRAAIHVLLETENDRLPALPPYLHVLGMTKGGKDILAASLSHLPMGTSLARLSRSSRDAEYVARLEGRAADLRALCCDPVRPCGSIYTTHPVILPSAALPCEQSKT